MSPGSSWGPVETISSLSKVRRNGKKCKCPCRVAARMAVVGDSIDEFATESFRVDQVGELGVRSSGEGPSSHAHGKLSSCSPRGGSHGVKLLPVLPGIPLTQYPSSCELVKGF
jgi:hypothetical protein